MRLTFATEQNKNDYQSFVKNNAATSGFLQDWDWGDFRISLGESTHRILIQDDGKDAENSGQIICAGQLIERSFLEKQYLFFPGGPVFSKNLLSSQDSNAKITEIFTILKKELNAKFPNLLFLRIEPANPEIADSKNTLQIRKTIDNNPHKSMILNLENSEEQLLINMKQKTRYNIKVAEKHNIKIKQVTDKEEQHKSFQLFENAFSRAGVHGMGIEYYQKLVDFFAPEKQKPIQVRIYCASKKVGESILASSLMLYWSAQNTSVYLFGGSSDNDRNLMAPYLLHWQAIKDAKAKGLRNYDFWGIEEDSNHPWHGFSKFKLGFAGQIVNYAGTWDLVLRPAWYNLYVVIRKLNRIIK